LVISAARELSRSISTGWLGATFRRQRSVIARAMVLPYHDRHGVDHDGLSGLAFQRFRFHNIGEHTAECCIDGF
jgi:hypothetical protein